MMSNLSVIILTYNEELNIAKCINSLHWFDEIVVLDSYSNDNTVDIVKSMGAKVYFRKFDNYAAQRNYALNEIEYQNNWLLMVDADETVSDELAMEMLNVINNDSAEYSLFRMRRKDMFMGRWIRHSSGYPTWFGRLMKIGEVKIEREINEEYKTDGAVGLLDGHLNHFPFNKGFSAWLDKHNRYSQMEALEKVKNKPNRIKISELFNKDPGVRRACVKSILYIIPLRPIVVFIGLYILRLGFLDGRAGFVFSILRMFYEFMIDFKVLEIKLKQEGSTL